MIVITHQPGLVLSYNTQINNIITPIVKKAEFMTLEENICIAGCRKSRISLIRPQGPGEMTRARPVVLLRNLREMCSVIRALAHRIALSSHIGELLKMLPTIMPSQSLELLITFRFTTPFP